MLQGIGGQWRLVLTGLAALLISTVTASTAGMYLGSSSNLLERIPGLMVLLPPSIDMRGNISGVLASRLSSSMHLGEFEIDFSRGSLLSSNLISSLVITLLTAFVLGVFATAISWLIGLATPSISDLVLISVVSGIISGVLVMGITLVVALASYRYGLDLDLIAAPAVTTAGDLVTLPVLILSAPLVLAVPQTIRTIACAGILLIVIGAIVFTRRQTEYFRKIVAERTLLLVPLAFIGTLAGAVYGFDIEQLVDVAAFLILLPPFMGGLGSIGGILGSRLSTGMHMGEINPSVRPERGVVHQFIISYLYTLVLLPLIAIIAHAAAVLLGLNSPGLSVLVAISLVAGMAIMTLVNGVAYITASLSFQYGLDPDNFGIPVITSLIDLIGAITLVAVINLLL